LSAAREAQDAPGPDAGVIAQAESLSRLLGPLHGRYQCADGAYPGYSGALTIEQVANHLAGIKTLGFNAADGEGRSRFLAIDNDERFPARLPLIATALSKRGLEAASICTSGSGPERGKVFTIFDRPRSAAGLRRLCEQILAEAQIAGPGWGIHRPQYVSIYPQGGDGGIVRIGGRNRRPDRNATSIDVTFGINGELRDFSEVVPAKRTTLPACPVRIEPAPRGAWVDKMLRDGLTWQGGTRKIIRDVYRLACEAMRLHGAGSIGEHEFHSWLDRIASASPDLINASPTTGDTRPILGWERNGKRAWLKAKLLHTRPPEERSMYVTSLQRRVFEIIRTFADKKGLAPWAVGISYRQIAKHVGLQNAMSAHRAVAGLANAGYLVIHDRGIAGQKGGRNVILGLVLEGQTVDEVRALGDKAGNVQQQRPLSIKARAIGRRVHRGLRFGAGAVIVRTTGMLSAS
jgi:hypothetical protein